MNSQRTLQITLYGNLGADPEIKILPGRTVSREVYDSILDDAVVKDFTTAARQIRTASLAVNGQDDSGAKITRWLRLVDLADHLTAYRKGDRIKVRGFFRNRTYVKDGEQKSIRELVVTAASLEKMKVREEAPAPAPKTRKARKDRAA